jgi:hypothetical protein
VSLTRQTAPLTMLNDNVDVLRAKSSGGGVRRSISSPSRATFRLRSCSGDGDGSGRIDPLRGGGDSTVICCGERSGAAGQDGLYGLRGGGSGGGGIESNDNTGEVSSACSDWIFPSAVHGVIATGVSPPRLRKSASGDMCAMRSPIGVTGIDVQIWSGGGVGGRTVDIAGGGGVERPDGALRMRKRCLNVVVRGEAGLGVNGEMGEGGGGGNGRVGGGLGGSSNAGGIT